VLEPWKIDPEGERAKVTESRGKNGPRKLLQRGGRRPKPQGKVKEKGGKIARGAKEASWGRRNCGAKPNAGGLNPKRLRSGPTRNVGLCQGIEGKIQRPRKSAPKKIKKGAEAGG